MPDYQDHGKKIEIIIIALDDLDTKDSKEAKNLAELLRWVKGQYERDKVRRSDISRGIITAVCSAAITIIVGFLVKFIQVAK